MLRLKLAPQGQKSFFKELLKPNMGDGDVKNMCQDIEWRTWRKLIEEVLKQVWRSIKSQT